MSCESIQLRVQECPSNMIDEAETLPLPPGTDIFSDALTAKECEEFEEVEETEQDCEEAEEESPEQDSEYVETVLDHEHVEFPSSAEDTAQPDAPEQAYLDLESDAEVEEGGQTSSKGTFQDCHFNSVKSYNWVNCLQIFIFILACQHLYMGM